ncbi:MHYT domain-containing protein [Marivivens donghaensis]
MLEYTHNHWMVLASLAIALIAGFTGLSLTRGASALPIGKRKAVVAMAAVALGGGIWSMHFVAMLGLNLPVLYFYDALTTLISALIAILITGVSLIIVHFGKRTRGRVLAAGAVMGVGIAVMHYTGMSGMELCRPVYTPMGILFAGIASTALSCFAFWIAYDRRRTRNILLGSLGFGVAVFAVHFVAMAGTGFVAVDSSASGPWISNASLAFAVTLVAFVILGAFLLTGINVAAPEPMAEEPIVEDAPETQIVSQTNRIPYEKEGKTHFVDFNDVAAIRAEGHYTVLYHEAERLFCPWSISEAENRIHHPDIIRTHRSYLVNTRFVTAFDRRKDTGVCYFDGIESLPKVPVARARISEVREKLGL